MEVNCHMVTRIYLSVIVGGLIIFSQALCCTLPQELLGQWTDVQNGGTTVSFTTNQLTGWPVTVAGENKNSHTCISNTGNVYVFRGDQKYTEFPVSKYYYLCMKLTKVSNDIFYYYLLSDENQKAVGQRIYTPDSEPDPSTPTCGYCTFSSTIPDSDVRELRKSGTSEVLEQSTSLCLPCEATCELTTTSQQITTTRERTTTEFTTVKITTEDMTTPDSSCNLPADLIGQWTDVQNSGATVTFSSTQLTGWPVKVAGESKSSHTCISNIGNVYVFRGDQKYTEFPVSKYYYFCMKLTKVSSDIFYYYLLSDVNIKAEGQRIYTPDSEPNPSTPTCGYCTFTSNIPDSDVRELRKLGTSEVLNQATSLCLPCDANCELTTISQQMATTPERTTTDLTTMKTTNMTTTSDIGCNLPNDLIGQWTDVKNSGETVSFSSTQLTGWPVKVAGENKNSHTCISNIGNVYVFRGDQKYTEFPTQKYYYLCMKLTKVSNDIFYYYLLSDENVKAERQRIYTPDNEPDPSTPTCGYCTFTTTIPDTDVRELRKLVWTLTEASQTVHASIGWNHNATLYVSSQATSWYSAASLCSSLYNAEFIISNSPYVIQTAAMHIYRNKLIQDMYLWIGLFKSQHDEQIYGAGSTCLKYTSPYKPIANLTKNFGKTECIMVSLHPRDRNSPFMYGDCSDHHNFICVLHDKKSTVITKKNTSAVRQNNNVKTQAVLNPRNYQYCLEMCGSQVQCVGGTFHNVKKTKSCNLYTAALSGNFDNIYEFELSTNAEMTFFFKPWMNLYFEKSKKVTSDTNRNNATFHCFANLNAGQNTTTPMFTDMNRSCDCRKTRGNNDSVDWNSIHQEILEIKGNLTINKSSLSASIRKHKSAYDPRVSSQVMGCVGSIIIGFVILTIVSSDIPRFVNYIRKTIIMR